MRFKIWEEVRELFHPLSTNEYQGLKDSISKSGIQVPIFVLSDGRIIDGVHRYRIAKELGVPTPQIPYEVRDIDERQAIQLAWDLNYKRRHLSLEQKKELVRRLREKGLTQKEVEVRTGVPQQTVSRLQKSINNTQVSNAYTVPDFRYKVSREKEKVIAERVVEKGESQAQVAADCQISQARVSQIVRNYKSHKRAEEQGGRVATTPEIDSLLGALRKLDAKIRTLREGFVGGVLEGPLRQLLQTHDPGELQEKYSFRINQIETELRKVQHSLGMLGNDYSLWVGGMREIYSLWERGAFDRLREKLKEE